MLVSQFLWKVCLVCTVDVHFKEPVQSVDAIFLQWVTEAGSVCVCVLVGGPESSVGFPCGLLRGPLHLPLCWRRGTVDSRDVRSGGNTPKKLFLVAILRNLGSLIIFLFFFFAS